MGNCCCGGSKTDLDSPSKNEAIVEVGPDGTIQNPPKSEEANSEQKYKIKSSIPDQQQQNQSKPAPKFIATKATNVVASPSEQHIPATVNVQSREEPRPKPKPINPDQCKDSSGRFNLETIFNSINPEILHIIPEGTFKETAGLAITPDNRYIVVTEAGELKFWDSFNQYCTKNVKIMNNSGTSCVSQTGKVVITASGGQGNAVYQFKNVEGGSVLAEASLKENISADQQPALCMRIASNESLALVISANGKLIVLNASSKKSYIEEKVGQLVAGDVSSDGRYIIATSDDALHVLENTNNELTLNRSEQYRERIKMESGNQQLTTPASSILSANNQTFYSGHADGSIVCWSIDSKYQIKYQYQLQAAHSYSVQGIMASKDGAFIISYDKYDIKIWDLTSKQCLKSFGTKRAIKNVVISTDDRYIVSSYQSGEIKIWNFGFFKDSPMLLSSSGHFLTTPSSENPDIFFSIFPIDNSEDSLIEALAALVEHSSFTPQRKRDLLKDLRKKVIEKASTNTKLIQETNLEKLKQALDSQKSNEIGNSLIRVICVLYDTEILIYTHDEQGQLKVDKIQNPDSARPKIRGYLLKKPQSLHYDALIGRVELQEFSQFLVTDEEARKRLEFVAECVL